VSANADRPAEVPRGLNAVGASFRISLKSKTCEAIADTSVDLWVACTLLQHGQVCNAERSRPFRESHHEPGLFAIWGFGQPLSRSWNHVIAQRGPDNGDGPVQVRPWRRVGERPEDDDSPDIERRIGQGERAITREPGTQIASARLPLASGRRRVSRQRPARRGVPRVAPSRGPPAAVQRVRRVDDRRQPTAG
jgi:hypothetical protein